jgi:hypothetical protein
VSRSIEFLHVEKTDLGCWTYLQRFAGELPNTPLYEFLNWFLEQLNLGNCEVERDKRGDVVSLTLGRDAAVNAHTLDGALEQAQRRLRAINYAGVFAQSRESGIEPEIAHVSKMATQQIAEWGRRNTEFHYAFELIKVLARLNKKTFNLEAPPITGLAPASVVSYLRESTRCWLYGFHGASVALSRACLEDTLKARLPEGRGDDQGSLEFLIARAKQRAVLDDCMVEVAHTIRKAGNRFLHGKGITETDSRETLDAIRSIVEHAFSP